MQRLRDLRDWLHARYMNRRTTDSQGPVGVMGCYHPNPPGFTACMFHQTYCRTCWQQFRC